MSHFLNKLFAVHFRFCGAELCHVYRGNLQELLAYGFYYKSL